MFCFCASPKEPWKNKFNTVFGLGGLLHSKTKKQQAHVPWCLVDLNDIIRDRQVMVCMLLHVGVCVCLFESMCVFLCAIDDKGATSAQAMVLGEI